MTHRTSRKRLRCSCRDSILRHILAARRTRHCLIFSQTCSDQLLVDNHRLVAGQTNCLTQLMATTGLNTRKATMDHTIHITTTTKTHTSNRLATTGPTNNHKVEIMARMSFLCHHSKNDRTSIQPAATNRDPVSQFQEIIKAKHSLRVKFKKMLETPKTEFNLMTNF